MAVLLLYLFCCVLPVGLGWIALKIPWAWEKAALLLHRMRPDVPLTPPIEQIAADLRRISGQLRDLDGADTVPGRVVRIRSTTAAYDETLLLACRALELPAPIERAPMSSVQRLEAEANLAGAGLRW